MSDEVILCSWLLSRLKSRLFFMLSVHLLRPLLLKKLADFLRGFLTSRPSVLASIRSTTGPIWLVLVVLVIPRLRGVAVSSGNSESAMEALWRIWGEKGWGWEW